MMKRRDSIMNGFISNETKEIELARMKYALFIIISVVTFRKFPKIETLKNDAYAVLLLLKGTGLSYMSGRDKFIA